MKTNTRMSRIIGATILLSLVVMLFTTMAIGTFDKNMPRQGKLINQSAFFAEIEFTLYEGEGCGCVPLEGVTIFAYGLDTDHNDTNITDENGFCILELEINSNYRVIIENEDWQTIMFDFLVVDDQTFTFHMQEAEKSVSQNFPLLYNLLQRTKLSTKLLN